MICACLNKNIQIAQKLISIGTNLNIQEENGYTVLLWACINNDIETVAYILSWLEI